MDWVTAIWSVMAGACLMLALMHLVIWCFDRNSWANLWFFIAVISLIAVMGGELEAMRARTPAEFSGAFRWTHVIYAFWVLGCLGFVNTYFRSDRRWLLLTVLGLRGLAVVANFTTGENLHFVSIQSLNHVDFLGQSVAIPGEWVQNPWVRLGQFSSLVLVIYILDAAIRLWRGGTADGRRRALFVGGGMVFFVMAGMTQVGLVSAGVLRMPSLVSFAFVGMVVVMGYELSRDVIRATKLSHDLRAGEHRLSLAAEAVRMALWEWDLRTNRIWMSSGGQALFGEAAEDLDSKRFVELVHPEDRPLVRRSIQSAVAGPEPYAAEYRVILPDGAVRWITDGGRIDQDTRVLRGVSLDITDRKQAAQESVRQQQELAHLSRISILGELAGALAHELNQPLAAILGNSQVGRVSLNSGPPDLIEMAAIFDDIADDAKRMGGIIHSMRAMFKKNAVMELQPVDLNEEVRKLLQLLHSEIMGRRVKPELHLDLDLPLVSAGRVEIQQVLINLAMNALDAMKGREPGGRLEITTCRTADRIQVSVRDDGPGIPDEIMERLFEPFVSTKPGGLGLGLVISRNIIQRFRGELVAENHPDGGAVFRLGLPVIAD